MEFDVGHLLSALNNLGAWGILFCYIVWREQYDRKERREQLDARQKTAEAESSSRLELAKSLTALCMVIQGRPSV